MRPLTALLALSTLLLGGTSLYLYLQLRAAREHARHAPAGEPALRGEIARLEHVRNGLQTDLRSARVPAPSAPAPPPTAAATQPSFARGPDLTREQQQLFLRRQYRRDFRELGLSEREITAALDVLQRQAERARKPYAKAAADSPASSSDPQRDQAELAAVLGPQKAEQRMARKKLMPVRTDVNMLRMRLDDSGEPLSAEQQAALLELLAKTERTAAPRITKDDDPQQATSRMQSWLHDHERELREAAAPVLTSSQRSLLEEDAALQDALRMPLVRPTAPQAGSGPARP